MLFLPPVRLTNLGPRDGLVTGEAGSFLWEARLARRPVSYGLDSITLYKGSGRIVQLALYEKMRADPADGGIYHVTHRKVAAYNAGWLYGRKRHLAIIRRIVNFLER
ncbi:MAG: hypothetical protein M1299_05960 [Firmicutes bacterium]|nr:hypothetical protein [Bacillota bacterium]